MFNDSDDSDFDIDDEYDIDDEEAPALAIRRSRAVRWTAILVVASFALAGMSSLFRWF